jgi:hypothetical protein
MQEFQVLRVIEPALRMKAQVDSSSRGQKDFICREEKDCMVGHRGGPGNWWSYGSGWVLGFIAFFVYCLRAEMPFRCRWAFPGKKCLLTSYGLSSTSFLLFLVLEFELRSSYLLGRHS